MGNSVILQGRRAMPAAQSLVQAMWKRLEKKRHLARELEKDVSHRSDSTAHLVLYYFEVTSNARSDLLASVCRKSFR